VPSPIERGRDVAALLTGVWRALPPPLALPLSAVSSLAPIVLGTGGGALAYHRLRHAGLGAHPEAAPFHQAYRMHALEVEVQEGRLVPAFARLRAAGIEPLLGKGWAVARHYPETGLRPYGDIDLYVPAGQHAAAAAALHPAGAPPLPVDLHAGFSDLDDRDPEELATRSRTAETRGAAVRTFGPEDHLRLVALHALRHGLARATWLVDVAVLLEQGALSFDWSHLLGGRTRRAEAVACAILLASRLLGARLDGVPPSVLSRPVPSWLEPAVLEQWGRGSARRRPIEEYLRHPAGALREIPRHWPNAVAASAEMGAPWNEQARLPFQLAYATRRGAGALRRIWRGR
jgi:hypothetical protein